MNIVSTGDIVLTKNITENTYEEYRIMPTFLKCEIRSLGLYNKHEYKMIEYSDADINNNEISENTLFAQSILGKPINYKFIINNNEYEIISINKKEDIYANTYSALLREDIIKEEDKERILGQLHFLIKTIKEYSNNKCNFYHQTTFNNLISIMENGYIYSRNSCHKKGIKFNDNANINVITNTRNSVLDYVRFYFRTKNSTHYLSEGFRGGKIKPCFIVYNRTIIFNGKYNIIMTNKNAACKDFQYNSIYNEKGLNNVLNYNWKNIYNENFDYNNIEEKQASCAELLIHDKVNINDCAKIIFRTHGDMMLFKHLYPDSTIPVEYNPNLFFNNTSHYVTSNFELKSYNDQAILEIEYLQKPNCVNHIINIHLKNNTVINIKNFDTSNKKVLIPIEYNINNIKKITYYMDNKLIESWGNI